MNVPAQVTAMTSQNRMRSSVGLLVAEVPDGVGA